ncbi:hypothetical protein SAMN05428957_106213 [Oryzisolibacter propanilivorax]|uniref:DUF2946 domain-containing protein n=1 Tax=Oryzisolibacter propanilivorax TaxID=1527607 RepID=A0A1G9TMC7_9BURK|nr:hypothetical protein [Oryzisolibacter propanilivorax]SDM48698.1 hypothetical protein SAMN05428957_106213 [Oryzisolibacter propanilivorax]
MSVLHCPPRLARLLLACFALALGVASAAPLVQAPALQQLCSAAGEVRWAPDDGPGAPASAHALECALCLPPLLPAPPPWLTPAVHAAPQPVAAPAHCPARVAQLSRAPFPPRAPPA